VRAPNEVADVLTRLRSRGGRVHYVQADIAESRDRRRLVDDVIATLGTPSALVNNAGRAPRAQRSARGHRSEFRRADAHEPAGPYFLTQASPTR
jgi:NAD(P)-dependent dehydrogenase (short-subunit alcohol dehydrogenase family)